ncbi:hypothetical protein GOP47_0008342 [Adiantum capillus-veneris]|uniref:Amine oxidase domain-containing protein n=1 Tax=Adiantum capillus-veneris TaxID=13818 RepID=A0A9D4UYV7_ADICA|nr:hypothetical protein GOP47_0008342 [Adiantum capillus-veneris]
MKLGWPTRPAYMSAMAEEQLPERQKKGKAVVVGGGWAGFGAAHALAKAGLSVTLLDAASDPGGLSTGYRTSQGRPVEAGIKGFWWQYGNIYELVKELGIPWPFTDWTRSTFYSPNGIQVEAPILSALPRLPAPFGSFIYTSPYFRSLSIMDRLTALPLLQALVEFDVDEDAYGSYDLMTAMELFRKAGVSAKLYKEFLEPMLLITLFAPPEQLSAAAALAALYFYVLAHQPDFDVCWCKGSVAEKIFRPWLSVIEKLGGQVLGGKRVQSVLCNSESKVSSVLAMNTSGHLESYEADVVIFAVGVQAMQKIVASSDVLAGLSDFAAVSNLGTVDVMAIRFWLDCMVELPNAANVLAGFEPTTGGTLFHLNSLQDEFKEEKGSIFEVDFYHANQLLNLSNDKILSKVFEKYLVKCDQRFASAKVLDSSVLRFKGAVTCFGPGSHRHMPSTCTSLANVFMAGDWLKQGPGSHGAKGLSQEKAYVTGLQAANAAISYLGLPFKTTIVDVEEDEPHVAAAKSVARQSRRAVQRFGFKSPFL